MKLIGIHFYKLEAEKKNLINATPKINSSINIDEIKEIDSKLFSSKETPFEVKFKYFIKYEPDYAELNFAGILTFLGDQKEVKEILKKWDKKELDDNFKTIIFNVILRKVTLKAAQLEEELDLPIHFQLPSLKFSKEPKESKDSKEK